MDEMRAMLDSLMGKDRNAPLVEQQNKRKQKFYDDDVCKYYLIDFCPHDLFPNTRSNLGPCPRIHNDTLKDDFENDPNRERYAIRYEEDFIAFLQQLVDQVDQKIKKGNARIDAPLPSERGINTDDLSEEKRETIQALNSQISSLLKQAEDAGTKNNIEEAETISRQVTAIRRQIDKVSTNCTPFEQFVHREKQLCVCSICGAMQSSSDSASRFESHVTGKQHQVSGESHVTGKIHQGYERIRNTLKDLLERREERMKKMAEDREKAATEEVAKGKSSRRDRSHTPERPERRLRRDRSKSNDRRRRRREDDDRHRSAEEDRRVDDRYRRDRERKRSRSTGRSRRHQSRSRSDSRGKKISSKRYSRSRSQERRRDNRDSSMTRDHYKGREQRIEVAEEGEVQA